MSYYPFWNGSIDSLIANMNDISERYDKEVIVAETSIGYTPKSLGCNGMVFSEELEKNTEYPATKEGQLHYMQDLYAAVRRVKAGRGAGVIYWEPAGCQSGNVHGQSRWAAVHERHGGDWQFVGESGAV